jgi:hypothetical protein
MRALRIALILVVLCSFVGVGRVTAQTLPPGMDSYYVSTSECYGQSLLTAPLSVDAGQTIEIAGSANYHDQLTFIMNLDRGPSYSFDLGVGGDSYSVSDYTLPEGLGPEYYTAFRVSAGGSSHAIDFTNNSSDTIQILAVCARVSMAQIMATSESCLNDTPYFDDYYEIWRNWNIVQPVYVDDGYITLGAEGSVSQIVDLSPGNYTLEIQVRAQTIDVDLQIVIGESVIQPEEINSLDVTETITYTFYTDGPAETISVKEIPWPPGDDQSYALVDILKVCLEIAEPTPATTETPIPNTPTPDYSIQGCEPGTGAIDNPPEEWLSEGLVEWDPGSVSIGNGGQIYQWFALQNGTYTLELDTRIELTEMDMIISAAGVTETVTIRNVQTERKVYYITPPGPGFIKFIVPEDSSDSNAARVVMSRICLKDYVPYPTATPSPTPTSAPADIECMNEDAGFEMGTWEIVSGNPPLDNGIYSLGGGGNDLIERATTLTGQYHIIVRARTSDNMGLIILYGDTKNPGGIYHQQKIVTISDGDFHPYDFNSQTLPAGSYFALMPATNESLQPDRRPTDNRIIEVDYICVTDDIPMTPTPVNTPLPGEPTFTPSPTAAPDYPPCPTDCLNDQDPCFSTQTYWALSDGFISGGIATLNPSGQLIQEFDNDPTRSYEVTLRTRLQGASYASANVNFNNSQQAITYDGTDWFEISLPFPRQSAGSMMAQGLDSLLEDSWQPLIFFSPLPQPDWGSSPISTPVAPTATPAPQQGLWSNGGQIMSSPGYLTIQSNAANAGTLEFQSVCVRYGEDPDDPPSDDPGEGDLAQVSLTHPVCERDWAIQRAFRNNVFSRFPAMLIGRQPGTPVHAVHGGNVTAYGPDTALTVDGQRYDNCVVIDHTDVFNIPLESWACNLRYYTVPGSFRVERGSLLGYTSEENNGYALVALQLDGEWVDPSEYYEGYVDCRPPYVIVEEIERCAADDGSGLIPPRYNEDTPTLWEVSQWVPWLAKRVYDIVGYPILCAIIPFFNSIIEVIQNVINALIKSLEAPLIFLYRLSRMFEFLLDMLVAVVRAILEMLDAFTDVTLCLRSIIVYFVAALSSSVKAEVSIERPQSGSMMYLAFQIAIKLISSTVANYLLVPMTLIFAGYASWRLIPWGAKKLRQAGGMGEG